MDLEKQDGIPLPGELDREEDSPYLRRQKAVAVRRGRISRRWRWMLFSVVVLLPAGIAGYFLATFALTSPHFVLSSGEDVIVVGNRFVSREEVLNALGLPLDGKPGPGINLFRFPLETRRKQVESIAWVASATLMRIYPRRLFVQVTERSPVAFVSIAGHVGLVDAEGVLLEKPETAAFDFPVLTGVEASGSLEERRSRLDLYQEFMRDVDVEVGRSGWMVSEVDLRDAEDLKALMVQGRETLQVHFGHGDFLGRFRNFLAWLPELHKSSARLESVDLRYRNQIVVNPELPAPAAAGPGVAASPADAGKE
jgi:cell division protein FtsQ